MINQIFVVGGVKSSFFGPAWAAPLDIRPKLVEKNYTSAISKSSYTITEKKTCTPATPVDGGPNFVASKTPDRRLGSPGEQTSDRRLGSPEEHFVSTPGEQVTESKERSQGVRGEIIYITDGVFCSINCCVAWVKKMSKRNTTYRDSIVLLAQMYNFVQGTTLKPLPPPAPSWKMLKKFGGRIELEEFRQNSNKISYVKQGKSRTSIFFSPLSSWYEENLKF